MNAKHLPENKKQCRPGSYEQAIRYTHSIRGGWCFFCDWWINMNSVSKLPSLRHFPTNRLNTLCPVAPPPPFTAYTLTSFVSLCVSTPSPLVRPSPYLPYFLPYCLSSPFPPSLCFPILFPSVYHHISFSPRFIVCHRLTKILL